MDRRVDGAFPQFHIGQFDRVAIEGRALRLVGQTADTFVLAPESGHGLAEAFPFERLNQLNALGKIRHEPDGLLTGSSPRPARGVVPEIRMGSLSPKEKTRVDTRYAMVAAFNELYAEGAVLMTEASIAAAMTAICQRAAPHLVEEADLAAADREARARVGQGRRRMGGGRSETVDPVHPRTLLGWVRRERAQGKGGLVDGFAKRGGRMSWFTPEEVALLMDTVRAGYLNRNQPTKKAVTDDVRLRFLKANEARAAAGLAPLRTPSRAAVRAAIGRLDAFEVVATRESVEEARKRFRPVGQSVEVSRPLERVEMDEWRIDLMTLMASAGLLPLFSAEELKTLGLDDGKARWWVAAAIDRRTRVILGMVLTKDPRSSAALSCLRMVVTHKRAISDATGAACVWEQFGVPELLVYDNGPGFRATVFKDACNDLGVAALPAPAGVPEVRGMIERVFGTSATNLLPRLAGRTFSDVLDRGDHPSAARACLTPEDLCFALVRWIVDIYHNTPHAGLGGRTPSKQWDLDHRDGLLPLRAAPDRDAKRLAFGVKLERRADKSGVVVMGVRYHGHELAAYVKRRNVQTLTVRWDPKDIGAVDVCLDGTWIAAPAVHPGFEGLDAQVWLAARRALRAESPKERSFREETVLRAIEAIKAMNAHRTLAFGLIDQPFDAKRLQELERDMFASFAISDAPALTRPRDGGAGRSVTPRREAGAALPQEAEEDAPAPRKRGDDAAPWTFDA